MFLLGKAYIQEIEDCQAGTETLEKLRTRFTAFEPMDEVLFVFIIAIISREKQPRLLPSNN